MGMARVSVPVTRPGHPLNDSARPVPPGRQTSTTAIGDALPTGHPDAAPPRRTADTDAVARRGVRIFGCDDDIHLQPSRVCTLVAFLWCRAPEVHPTWPRSSVATDDVPPVSLTVCSGTAPASVPPFAQPAPFSSSFWGDASVNSRNSPVTR